MATRRKKAQPLKRISPYALQFDAERERWCVYAYGKCFYFGKTNYPDTEAAKSAAEDFIHTLPEHALI
ncbi:hypothetical protein [Endozoicomonas atrinae]|uniref:hypothetical protein n=1 Tax=Endozoicomonas atrinae TaxID=1333660 RepID=UPI0008270625|nr:hypothetical protein [Endozoicomonas atrinae]